MRRAVLCLSCLFALPACGGGDDCLFFDYPPPSATFQLRDTETDELLCDATVSAVDRGDVVRDVERCEYRLANWYPTRAAGRSVTLRVTGYFERSFKLPVTRDECDRIEEPPRSIVEVTPDPNYED